MRNTINETGNFRSPKRNSTIKKGKTEWYNYYAGYSEVFVQDVLEYIQLSPGSIILDPWNGSGTTTYVAEKNGLNAIGFDINPVMPIIANSRRVTDVESILKFHTKIVKQAKRYRKEYIPIKDPLKMWLSDSNVVTIRRIERAIQSSITNRKNHLYAKEIPIYEQLITDPVLAFYYLVLFRLVKELLHSFKASNPTWIKQPINENDKVEVDQNTIYQCFSTHLEIMLRNIIPIPIENKVAKNNICLNMVSSQHLLLNDSCIDAVITSPPYCTRIDYVVATRLELAVIGIGDDLEFEQLRNQMIGTIKVVKEEITENRDWGITATTFLNNVRNHQSKASKSYYLKQYLQYFNSIFISMSELNRVLKKNGTIVIVVQDSYYKDVHLDLPQVYIEMGEKLGWKLKYSESYFQSKTLAGINKSKEKYRRSSSAIEKALVFNKGD
ncbi:DNA methyltransferase [Paenibacillus favisporus]|uniref:DNA methyltransferase n=1 Tax=Paenibacillus favisporus TaxID=221028 RepID=UPI003D27EF3E